MANNIKGITIELGGDTTKLDKALSGSNKAIKDTQNELREVEKLLKLDPKNTELLAQKQKLLADAVGETKAKLDTLKEAEKQVQEQVQRGEASQKQYDALKREIIATENQLKELEEQAAQSNVTLAKIGAVADDIGKKSEALGKKLMPISTAVTGIGVASGKLAADFEDGMAKVSTLIDTGVHDMDALGDGVLGVSDKVGLASGDVAEAMYSALSAGVELGDEGAAMFEFLERNAMLAKAGFTDVDTAVGTSAKILNAYGKDVSETSKIHEILMLTQNKGITTVGELGSSLAQVTPTAAAMSVEFEQVGASLAVMTAQGTSTSQATTQLNSLFAELGKSGTKASNSLIEATEGTKYAGKSFQELMADGVPLTELLSLIQDNADESGLSMLDMFSSIEAGKAALSISNGEQAYADYLEELAAGTNLVDEGFAKVAGTSSEQLKMAINQLKNTAIDLGTTILEMLQPAIQAIVEKIRQFTEWFGNLTDSQKKIIVTIGAVVAAIGPALIVFGKLSQGVSTVTGIISKLGASLGGGAGLSGVLSALTGPVGIVIAAIAALAAGFIALYKNNEDFRNKVNETFAKVKEAFSQLKDAIQPAIEALKNAFLSLMTALQPVFEYIITKVMAIVQGVMAAAEPIIQAVTNVVEFVTNIINAFMALIQGDTDAFWEYIKSAFQNVLDFITNILTAIVSFVVGYLEGMGVDIKQIFTDIWNAIVSIFQGVGQWFSARWTDIKNAFSAAVTWFQTTFQNAYNAVMRVFQAIGQWFAARWTDIKNALSNVATWFQTMFQNAYNNVTRVFQAIGQWFAARWTDIKNALADVANWFQEKFQSAYRNVQQAFEKIGTWFQEKYKAITDVFEKIPNFFKEKFEEAVKTIKDAFGSIVDWFSEIADKIKGFFQGIADAILGAVDDANDAADNAGRSNRSSGSGVNYYASGGVLTNGRGIVAEAGPELIEMVNGRAIITPLTDSSTNTPVTGSAGGGGITIPQTNNFFSPKALTPYETARLNRQQARRTVLSLQGV